MKSYLNIEGRGEGSILIEVEVLSHKVAYGRGICTVKPVSGEGSMTVNSERIIVRK